MIIRKPYAFLLKHFKLIHLILVFIMSYLIYKTGMITRFFSTYFAEGENVTGQEITNDLFGFTLYFAMIAAIIGLAIVLFLMFNKKKPVKYYAMAFINYLVLFVFISVCENIINQMEVTQLSVRTVKAFSDLTIIVLILQVVCIIPAFIRGIGFNIKQFDFEKDLQELDITEEDREEVEIGFGFDIDKIRRSINRNLRHMKYAYLENKLIANTVIVIGVVVMGYIVYTNLGFNEKKYQQGQYFTTSNFVMKITDSYIVNTNYQQERLANGKTLVVLRIKLKNKYTIPVTLELGRAELNVGGHKYYPTKQYKDEISDFGTIYDGNKVTTEEQSYVLCYVVPSNYLDKKMQFHYVDQINTLQKKVTTTYVKSLVSPIDLRGKQAKSTYKIGDQLILKNPILGTSELKITGYDVKKEYQLVYNYCVQANQCQRSFEYLRPNILTNYDKSLLKLSYEYAPIANWNRKYNDPYQLISYFGTIEYQIDGKLKTHFLDLTQVKPVKTNVGNVMYIEVLSELQQAEKIYLELNVRNNKYVYELK